MRRTQLYLDEDLWQVLQLRSRQSGNTLSELVRQAVRERYLGAAAERRRAMQAFAGSRKDRAELADSEGYIRRLRHGNRLSGLSQQ